MPEPTANDGHVDELISGTATSKRKRKPPVDVVPTMKASELPAAAFAIVGDPADPKTWKHPLWKDATGVVSSGRLHAAMRYAMKWDGPLADEGLPRLAAAYRALYPSRRLPELLTKGDSMHACSNGDCNLKVLPGATSCPAGHAYTAKTDVDHGMLVPYDEACAMRMPADIAAQLVGVEKADLSPADARSRFFDAVGQVPDDEIVPCMIGFGLPADIAEAIAIAPADGIVAQAPEDLHVTLAYVRIPAGRMSQALTLVAAAMRAACAISPFQAQITGVGMFIPNENDDDAPLAPGDDDGDADSDGPWFTAVALIDSVDLSDLRGGIIDQLNDQGLPVDDYTHGFVPHVTLAVAQDPAALAALPLPEKEAWTVDSFCVAVGGEVAQFPLIGGWAEPSDLSAPSYVAMAASDDEKHYTFAPLYVPGRLDTHKEWITRDDLQETQWEYVRCGDRTVNLQHLPGTVAGEWVDIACLPFEVDCDLVTVDGVRKSVTVPADTVWMGTLWNDAGWAEVKAGRIQGMSLEGFAIYDLASPVS